MTADLDLATLSVRQVNAALQQAQEGSYRVLHPGGAHALACGLDAPLEISIDGHAGYYCAGMSKEADITVMGNAGTGCAENVMSGSVRVKGDVSQSLAASGHGGLVVVEGSASARAGISMKGVDIVVGHLALDQDRKRDQALAHRLAHLFGGSLLLDRLVDAVFDEDLLQTFGV